MTSADETELRALRRRAYGPAPDIEQDPEALRRLRELEARAAGATSGPVVLGAPRTAPALAAAPDAGAGPRDGDDAAASDDDNDNDNDNRSDAPPPLRRLPVVLGIAVLAVAAVVAVVAATLAAPRPSTAPLQPAARQVARLPVDAGYIVPSLFGGPDAAAGFASFHGMRAVVSGTALTLSSGGSTRCLSVFAESAFADPSASSFSGAAYGGCAAGAFPATIQFIAKRDVHPAELLSTVADGTALQFLYDATDNEVVVFADR